MLYAVVSISFGTFFIAMLVNREKKKKKGKERKICKSHSIDVCIDWCCKQMASEACFV